MYTVSAPTQARRGTTLADLVGGSSLLRDGLLVVGFCLFTALCAQIVLVLPWTPVPITGQTLGALLAGAVLGSRRGVLSMGLYLLVGGLGLPFFAGGAAGWARFAGPTAGYLLALPLAALLVGWLAQRGWDRRVPTALAAMLLGNLLIYAIGLPWLNIYKGTLFMGDTVWAGVYPFLPGDALKIVLAGLALPGAWALLGRRSADS